MAHKSSVIEEIYKELERLMSENREIYDITIVLLFTIYNFAPPEDENIAPSL